MIRTADVFPLIAIAVTCWLFTLLRSTLSGIGNKRSAVYRLGLAGLALVSSGMITFDLRDTTLLDGGFLPPAISSLRSSIDNLGWLLVVSGLIFLFILFCVSLIRPNGKSNDKSENPVSEYLR